MIVHRLTKATTKLVLVLVFSVFVTMLTLSNASFLLRQVSAVTRRKNSLWLLQQQQQRQLKHTQRQPMARQLKFTPSFSIFSSSTAARRSTVTSTISLNDTAAVVAEEPHQRSSTRSSASSQRPLANRKRSSSNTGGLRRLPVVKSPKELSDKARKVLRTVQADTGVKNAKLRARKHGTETLNALTQALCVPLRDIVSGYRYEWKRLHPFERVVADLTARNRQQKDGLTLSQVLDDLHEGRKLILELGKDWISKVKTAETARQAGDNLQQGIDALLAGFDLYAAPSLASLVDLQKSLRGAPTVSLDQPAVVAVGAPNVGKSSIIRCISSATPEINNYPFTTRGMTLGHVEVFWSPGTTTAIDPSNIAKVIIPSNQKKKMQNSEEEDEEGHSSDNNKYAFSQLCQVMDTPGLLVRPDEERNEMEALTLAAMQHLPTAVMFVMDLSGEAGDKCSSISDQLQLRREIRSRFPKRPWIDVVSKVDMGLVEGAEQELQAILENENNNECVTARTPPASSSDSSYIKLSIHEGIGVNELKKQVLRMLGEVQLVLDAMARSSSGSTSTTSATADTDERV